MSDFPTLKTGAVLQYPAGRSLQHSTCVLAFLDGSEQRFREFPSPVRRWTVRLDLLDEREIEALEKFLIELQGRTGTFSFTDPWDATVHPNCSLEDDVQPLIFEELARSRSTLVIREERS